MDLLILVIVAAVVLLAAIAAYILKFKGIGSRATPNRPLERKESAKMEKHKCYGPIRIYYGSQTGTAANFARILGKEATAAGFEPEVIDLIDFKPEELAPGPKTQLAIFLTATHGEGEPTDNAVEFFKWLSKEDHPPHKLKYLQFTNFGLGNHQYQFFNAMGKKTSAGLEKLGATRVYKYGEGDDDVVIEDDFNEWKKDLWKELTEKIQPQGEEEVEVQEENVKKIPTTFQVEFVEESPLDLTSRAQLDQTIKGATEYEFMTKQWLAAENVPVTEIKELRQDSEYGSTLHVEFDLSKTNLKYGAAQNCLIFPENDEASIAEAADYLGVSLDKVFKLKLPETPPPPTAAPGAPAKRVAKKRFPIPTPINVRTCLRHFIDLHGAVKKASIKSLAEIAPNESVKTHLLEMAGGQRKEEYERNIEGNRMSLLQFLKEFKLKPSFEEFIEISNRITPRYYTIASSPVMHPRALQICISLTMNKLPNGKLWLGCVSGQLANKKKELEVGSSIPYCRITTSPSTFAFPTDKSTPIIMVGPGTGISPFRALLQEKEAILKEGKDAPPFGFSMLYFGCRKPNSDYIYQKELSTWAEKRVVDEYHVAFSRETDKKVYVQHLLESRADEVYKILVEQRGYLMVCGAMSMGRDVKTVIRKILQGKLGEADGDKFEKEMEERKAYTCELWGN